MSGYDLDAFFPLQGTCFHCGRDLRHHTLETIADRFGKGEDVTAIAADYNVPAGAIRLVIEHNSAAPLGSVFSQSPTPKARLAAA